jgi:hypothetical protein
VTPAKHGRHPAFDQSETQMQWHLRYHPAAGQGYGGFFGPCRASLQPSACKSWTAAQWSGVFSEVARGVDHRPDQRPFGGRFPRAFPHITILEAVHGAVELLALWNRQCCCLLCSNYGYKDT